VSPAGHVHLEAFYLDGTIPVWVFAIGLTRIEARVWLEPGANTSHIAWRLLPHPRVVVTTAVAARPPDGQ